MTGNTIEQMQLVEATAMSVVAKLEAFEDSLSPQERLTLSAALWTEGTDPDATTSDVAGYRNAVEGAVRARIASMSMWSGLQQLVASLTAPIDPNKGFDGSPPYSPK